MSEAPRSRRRRAWRIAGGVFVGLVLLALLPAACPRHLTMPRVAAAAARATPLPEASDLAVAADIDLSAEIAQLETQVPREIDQTAQWEYMPSAPAGVKYRVHRDPFTVAVTGDTLHVETVLNFSVEACLRAQLGAFDMGCPRVGSCGIDEPLRRVRVGFDVRLLVGPDWSLRPQTSVRPPVPIDACRITVLQIDVIGYVTQRIGARLMESVPRIERRLRDLAQLRARAEPLWAALQRPFPLDSNLWLVMNPRAISGTPLSGAGTHLSTTLVVRAYPTIVAGSQPAVAVTPLPPVMPAFVTPQGFTANVEIRLPFEQAEAGLRRQLVGREFVRGSLGARVLSVRIANQQGVLVADANVEFTRGWFSGRRVHVRLVGAPRFDPATTSLVADGFDYELQTSHPLLRWADWVLQGRIRRSLAQAARWPLGARVAAARARGEQALNRPLGPRATMRGQIASLAPTAIIVERDAVRVTVRITGRADVDARTR